MTLKRFPQRTLRGDTELFRIHRARLAPWWFSSDGSGRFDPLGTGLGACSLAIDALGAWVEVFRATMLLDSTEVQRRALARVRLGRDVRLADVTSRRALQFAITAAVGADRRYDQSQAFAARAVNAGFGGIRYLVRHDPAQRLYGVALFGAPGAADQPGADWSAPDDGPIPGELAQRARALFGYRVITAP